MKGNYQFNFFIIATRNKNLEIFIKLNTTLMYKGIISVRGKYPFRGQMQCVIWNIFKLSMQSLKIPVSVYHQKILW